MSSTGREPSPQEALSLSRQALRQLLEAKEQESNKQLAVELFARCREVRLLDELSELMAQVTDLYELGDLFLAELRATLEVEEAALALVAEGHFLELIASSQAMVPLHQLQLLEEAFITGEVLAVSSSDADDFRCLGNADLPEGKSLRAIPLFRHDHRPLGVLYMEGGLLCEQTPCLDDITRSLANGLEDCLQYNRIERLIDDAVLAIAESHETRRAGNPGRPFRVENLAVLLAQALGLGATRQKQVRRVALLSAMTAEDVMRAFENMQRGELTAQQWDALMGKPFVGGLYASPLADFQRTLEDLSYLSCRWDGRDAKGLQRDEIPMSARIVAVATAFYQGQSARQALGSEATSGALAAMRRESGWRFDPAVVTALVSCMKPSAGEKKTREPYNDQ